MLKRVHIHQFRSCQDVLLEDLGGVLALVGPNGVGKTNILWAIDWVARAATTIDPWIRRDRSHRSVEIDVELGNVTYRFAATTTEDDSEWKHQNSLSIVRSENDTDLVFERDGSEVRINGDNQRIRIAPLTPVLQAIDSLLPQDDPLVRQVQPLTTFLASLRYYPLDEPSASEESQLIKISDYEEWKSQQNDSVESTASVPLRILDAYKENSDDLAELLSLLGRNGLGLIDHISVATHSVNAALVCGYATLTTHEAPVNESSVADIYRVDFFPILASSDEGNRGFTYQNLSLGTRRVLRILTSLLLDKRSVILLEHPEDGIHRGLLHKIIGLIEAYSDSTQVILTTHSATVLNSLRPESVRLVTMEEGKTQARPLSDKEQSVAERYLNDEGSLADLLETLEEV